MENLAQGNPAAAAAWRAYGAATRSVDTEQEFIVSHLPLVKTVVNRMRITLPATLDLDDLYSVGVTGLIAATKRYDPSRNTAFAAFAGQHIRGAVLDELRRMDHMPRGAREKAQRFTEAVNKVEQRTMRPATPGEICEELGVSESEYDSLLEEARPISFMPLDGEAFTENPDDVSLHDLIADDTQRPASEALEKKELIQLVMERIEALPDMPRKILAMYYFEDFRLSEIAAAFGVTEGRISQIHTQTVLSLRAFTRRISGQPSAQCS